MLSKVYQPYLTFVVRYNTNIRRFYVIIGNNIIIIILVRPQTCFLIHRFRMTDLLVTSEVQSSSCYIKTVKALKLKIKTMLSIR